MRSTPTRSNDASVSGRRGEAKGISKKEVTPYLPRRIVELTRGAACSQHGAGEEQRGVAAQSPSNWRC